MVDLGIWKQSIQKYISVAVYVDLPYGVELITGADMRGGSSCHVEY